jgi:hypothetical protein
MVCCDLALSKAANSLFRGFTSSLGHVCTTLVIWPLAADAVAIHNRQPAPGNDVSGFGTTVIATPIRSVFAEK